MQFGVGLDSVQPFADDAVLRFRNQNRDSAVAVFEQVIDRETSGKGVVRSDRQQLHVSAVTVHQHQWNLRRVLLKPVEDFRIPRSRTGQHRDPFHVLRFQRQGERDTFAVIVTVDQQPVRRVLSPDRLQVSFHERQIRRVPARNHKEEGRRNFRIQFSDLFRHVSAAPRNDAQQPGGAEPHHRLIDDQLAYVEPLHDFTARDELFAGGVFR